MDVYDPNDDLDTYLNDEILAQYNLYREAPSSTISWTHLKYTETALRPQNF